MNRKKTYPNILLILFIMCRCCYKHFNWLLHVRQVCAICLYSVYTICINMVLDLAFEMSQLRSTISKKWVNTKFLSDSLLILYQHISVACYKDSEVVESETSTIFIVCKFWNESIWVCCMKGSPPWKVTLYFILLFCIHVYYQFWPFIKYGFGTCIFSRKISSLVRNTKL